MTTDSLSALASRVSSGLACDAEPGDVMAWIHGHHILRVSTLDKAVADVLDGQGNVIGSAHRGPYRDYGWAIHTKDWAGFAPNSQIRYLAD